MHISESSGQDMDIFSLYLNKRLYEPSTGRVIKNNLKKGSVFVDCGSSHGYFSLMASKLVGETGKVYSFEAYLPTYGRLKRNIRLNNCRNVTAYNFAVGSKKGMLKMNLRYEDGSNSFVNVPFSVGTVMVKVVKLDDMIKGRVNLIKIDVEGWEKDVLVGGSKLIDNNKDVKIILEYNHRNLKLKGERYDSAIDLLNSKDFTIREILDGGFSPPITSHTQIKSMIGNLYCSR